MQATSLTQLATACALALGASLAQAQVSIDQNKALAGGLSVGDSAGFPVILSQSGSYKLTSNLVVPAGSKGIVVTAPQVTIDLNGYSLIGPSTCTRDASTREVVCMQTDNITHGIDASAGGGTAVRNGTVKGFGGYGIYAGGMDRYEALRLTENAGGVGEVAGLGYSISSSTIDLNGSNGVFAARGLVTNCRVARNGANGVSGTAALVVADSTVTGNRLFGLASVAARGTQLELNGTNRSAATVSMGGNLDVGTPF